MALIRMIAAAGVVAALSGCAHQISLSTDESKVPALSTQPLDMNVAIVITDEQSTQEVITPGGGGDKVNYQPCRHRNAMYVSLGHVFKNVTKLKVRPTRRPFRRSIWTP